MVTCDQPASVVIPTAASTIRSRSESDTAAGMEVNLSAVP